MNILALDTCFSACSVAVGRDLGSGAEHFAAFFEEMETGHAERLMPMLAQAMSDAGLAYSDVDCIAVTIGPGSFTGTRISVAAARSLGLATGAGYFTATSLQVMAARAARTIDVSPEELVAVAVDARRDEVYVQLFGAGGTSAIGPPQVMSLKDAAAVGRSAPVVFVGSASAAVASAARGAGRPARAALPSLVPDARDLLAMATRGEVSMQRPHPLYLRPADAKPQTGKTIERARNDVDGAKPT